MKAQEVTGLIKTARSDASSQIAGFLYQFIVALDYCFQLSPGQSLYIEKYGDVAIKDDGSYDGESGKDVSVEIKMYADEIDVNHHNLLNTLYNWMEDDFDFEKYQTLIVYTTQKIAKKSPLQWWNSKKTEERVRIVTGCFNKYLTDNKAKIEDKDASKYKTIKKNAKQMQRVIGTDKLSSLLERVVIVDSCKNLEQAYNGLMKYAKVTTENLQETFINCLLGFIISPKNVKNGWRIDYDKFTAQVQLLAVEMAPQSITFPDAPDVTVKDGEYDDSLFVQKLKQIESDRITDAVMDFAKTTGLLAKELDRPSAEKNLADYQTELLQIYNLKHEIAVDELAMKGEVTNDYVKIASRVFYNQILLAARIPQFAPFGVTKPYFSNGMCHYMANDKEQNIKWLLNDE
jgi:5'(3')-deoxyribonucleotidase